MPSLHVLKGANEGALIPLEGDKVILGRNPDCGVVIPATSVSRTHATILRVHGKYYIVDGDGDKERSRNGTFVNNQAVTARTPLKNNDKIRICDFQAAFLDGPPPDDDGGDDTASSTVEAMLGHSSHLLLETQPAERLRGLLEISSSLNQTLQIDLLFPKIGDSLFQLFRQADRCFLILAEDGGKRLLPRLVKTRRPGEETTARFSRAIVRRCLESAQAFLSDDATRDDRVQLSQSVVDFRIRSVMCVPLCAPEGKAFGVIQLDTQDRSKKFTQDDLKLLWGVANQAAVALENARLHGEAVEQERIRRDLELARQVQLSFLPRSLPQVPGYEFFAHYESALEVGGDYYGFIPMPDGRLAVALGDVAGKGVPAALLMAKLSSDARFSLLTESDPGRAVSKLNDLLYEFTSVMDRFVTLTAAVLDPATHAITLVNAGHLSPLLFRQRAAALEEAAPRKKAGVPLGVMEGFAFESCQATLEPGDSLILYTDGLPDAVDQANAPFGPRGIQSAVLDASGPSTPRALGERLVTAVRHHAAGRDAPDDLTLVCLGRTA
jgi:serine phosphatase RsbU (regulator of sigma subunit)/pSer/pThr/pTyr-binding forkhead associated (FHA) protein